VAGFQRRQERHDATDLGWLTETRDADLASHRPLGAGEVHLMLRGKGAEPQGEAIRRNPSRIDCVDPHAIPDTAVRERFGHIEHRGVYGTTDGELRVPRPSADAADVDDGAAARLEIRPGRPATSQRAAELQRKPNVP